MAGKDGLAVMSLGLIENITDLTFENNSFFCASGKYSLEEDSDEVEVCPFLTRRPNFKPKSQIGSLSNSLIGSFHPGITDVRRNLSRATLNDSKSFLQFVLIEIQVDMSLAVPTTQVFSKL